MSDPNERIDQLTPLQRAAFALKDLRARLDASERSRTEPIAIVGMGCRFPGGVRDPGSFWDRLLDGFDAITEVPPSRWDSGRLPPRHPRGRPPRPGSAGSWRTSNGSTRRSSGSARARRC